MLIHDDGYPDDDYDDPNHYEEPPVYYDLSYTDESQPIDDGLSSEEWALKVAREFDPDADQVPTIPPPESIVITGSRSIGFEYYHLVVGTVAQLRQKSGGHLHIHVGDADGVDAMVIQTCEETNTPYTCWYVDGDLHQEVKKGELRAIEGVFGPGGTLIKKQSYVVRDKAMVSQSGFERLIAIWDGSSRGTLHTMLAASRLDKRIKIVVGEIVDNRLRWITPTDFDIFNWAKEIGIV